MHYTIDLNTETGVLSKWGHIYSMITNMLLKFKPHYKNHKLSMAIHSNIFRFRTHIHSLHNIELQIIFHRVLLQKINVFSKYPYIQISDTLLETIEMATYIEGSLVIIFN